jgi:hypothetical protein
MFFKQRSHHVDRARRHWRAGALGVLASVALHQEMSYASSGIVVETVSDYTFVCGNTSCDTDANTEGNGFWNAMTASGTGWTGTHHYMDNSVFDTDFEDPQYTGLAADNDTTNFDSAGVDISFLIAHGVCDDVTSTVCTSDASCNAAAGGYCPGEPLQVGEKRTCINQAQRRIVTSSTFSQHSNFVWYGANGTASAVKTIGLGESANSGGFAGAGTNGGANVAVIVNSCGIRSHHFLKDTQNFYAGVHSVMMTMPVASYLDTGGIERFSDTRQWGARGSTFAGFILANPLAAASDAWFNPTMVNNSYTGPSGHNFGAQIVIAEDSTADNAIWHVLTESWIGTIIDSNDAKGNSFWGAWFVCNYDCNTFGD